jgi:hypothetical protein
MIDNAMGFASLDVRDLAKRLEMPSGLAFSTACSGPLEPVCLINPPSLPIEGAATYNSFDVL